MKRLLYTFLFISLLYTLPPYTRAEDVRGFKDLVYKDKVVKLRGKQVILYKESHALVIGVSDYTSGWTNLDSVPKEIENVVGALQKQGFSVTKVLNPDRETLENAFKKFIDAYGFDSDNRLLFFFSGHGYTRKGDKGYLVPVDAPHPKINKKGFLRKAIDMDQIRAWAKRIEAKHALFLFDSCFSGTIFLTRSGNLTPPEISLATSKPVRQFITAGGAKDEVPAQSIFTPSFINALAGDGDLNMDGFITGTELGMHLRTEVSSYKIGQTPQYGKIDVPDLKAGDFVFILPDGVPPAPPIPDPIKKPRYARLEVDTTPSGADIYINNDNKPEWNTQGGKLVWEKLQAGEYRIKAMKKGYKEKIEVVLLEKGDQKITLKLERMTPEDMVFIKGGWFDMGQNKEDKTWLLDRVSEDTYKKYYSDEWPHRVFVDDFYIGEHEVTKGEFRKFIKETGHKTDAETKGSCWTYDEKNEWVEKKGANWRNPGFPQDDNHPVVCVSYNDAIAYASWSSEEKGKDCRLPTEAEWEYAARSGGKKERYAGFSDEKKIDNYANFCDENCTFSWKDEEQNDGFKFTAPIKRFAPNGLGTYDMTGNVWEWVADWYDKDYYKTSPKDRPQGPEKGEFRVLRGGSWSRYPNNLRAAYRFRLRPTVRLDFVGFRCAGSFR